MTAGRSEAGAEYNSEPAPPANIISKQSMPGVNRFVVCRGAVLIYALRRRMKDEASRDTAVPLDALTVGALFNLSGVAEKLSCSPVASSLHSGG